MKEIVEKTTIGVETDQVYVAPTVDYCPWCPDPTNPSIIHHPDGHPSHLIINFPMRELGKAPGVRRQEDV